ncbi:hypothetical protein MVEN_00344200 [Mycena venus]|uniref:Uncharacterized protein n=1 Tax=Mycena venus TaxID=2733690 RepID=A0A8H6YU74_9AGAR|nr:hypothetical protein MVEN_00344200 [Mycena venus]
MGPPPKLCASVGVYDFVVATSERGMNENSTTKAAAEAEAEVEAEKAEARRHKVNRTQKKGNASAVLRSLRVWRVSAARVGTASLVFGPKLTMKKRLSEETQSRVPLLKAPRRARLIRRLQLQGDRRTNLSKPRPIHRSGSAPTSLPIPAATLNAGRALQKLFDRSAFGTFRLGML